jgi:hypothetical protein
MKKLPIGIQAFEVMRARGYLYVDKTQHVYRMVDEGMFYFMARPRRFGKSLLVSTLKCLFEGRRDLFEGLWIAEHGAWAWEEHPTVVLDFNGIPGSTPEVLRRSIAFAMKKIAAEHDLTLESFAIETQLQELILGLHKQTQMPVAVLIDEYDKPIISHLGRGEPGLEMAQGNREVLRSFYAVLKEATISTVLGFVFLTGVSQFSKVSIFSELNNLRDISMNCQYATLLGYTQEDLEIDFEGYLRQFAERLDCSYDDVRQKLIHWYDGYRFSECDITVYNPFSVLNALGDGVLGNYWFETGTPKFLIDLLRQERYDLPKMEDLQIARSIFTAFDIDRLYPEALLFQTGYLTIKDVMGRLYTLGYPNQEVKTAFTESLLLAWTEDIEMSVSSHVLLLAEYLQAGELEAFFEAVRAVFASIPYDIEVKRDEAYFHTIFYLMIAASGGAAQSSVLTSRGRIDLVVSFPDRVYIIEFKCNQSAEVAIKQIQDQGYAEKYKGRGREIVLLGINFSTEKRNVEDWRVERLGAG